MEFVNIKNNIFPSFETENVVTITDESGRPVSTLSIEPKKLTLKELDLRYKQYVRSIDVNSREFYATFEEYCEAYEKKWKEYEDEKYKREQARLLKLKREADKQLAIIKKNKLEQELREQQFRERRREQIKREYEMEFGTQPIKEVKKVEPKIHEPIGKRLITLE